ncbi:MAG: hypothetical protein KC619_29345, partial [Myxococcales bacterium]|nr:hypothetical protein [Myxococcales bacterium]
ARGPGRTPPPPARRLPPAAPVPKSDTGLYIGLAVVAFLILGLIIAIIVGVAGEVGSDDDETTEQVD